MRPEIMEGIRRHIQRSKGWRTLHTGNLTGHARLSVEVIPESLNLYGNAHGGFLFSLCDMAAGMSTYAYEIVNVTQNSSIQFLRGVSQGTVFVESNAVHKGSKTVVNQVTITDSEGRLLVTAAYTMFLLSGDLNEGHRQNIKKYINSPFLLAKCLSSCYPIPAVAFPMRQPFCFICILAYRR